MSRRHRRQTQRKGFPWPVVAFGGVLVLAAVFMLTSRGGGGNEGGTPAIAVDQQVIDYGYVPFGNEKSFTVKVTNTGDGPLRFKEQPYIEVLEGC